MGKVFIGQTTAIMLTIISGFGVVFLVFLLIFQTILGILFKIEVKELTEGKEGIPKDPQLVNFILFI